jgi:hypothetical protein
MTKTTETIDITPTWESLVPALVHIIQHSKSATARADIVQELKSMAQAADRWNLHCRESWNLYCQEK